MVTLNLQPCDCRNAADLIDTYFFQNIKDLLEIGEIDNINYVRSLINVLDELERVAGGDACDAEQHK